MLRKRSPDRLTASSLGLRRGDDKDDKLRHHHAEVERRRSGDLLDSINAKDRQYLWHPFTQHKQEHVPLVIEKAEGAYLYTADGRKLFDGISSWWANLHGHCHPKIIEAVNAQFKRIDHVMFAGFTHEPAVNLAESLLNILPSSMGKIFYSDNGSTAVETALKISLQYGANRGQARKKFIAFRNAYHGDTFGAMSVSERGAFTEPFHGHLCPEVRWISPPLLTQVRGLSYAQLKTLLEQEGDDLVAFIYEPLIQGAAGMLVQDAGELDSLLGLAKKYGVLCIADEVMTGFGRSGRLFASDYMENKPDLVCLSKGLTGGVMPLGVTACSSAIFEEFLSPDPKKTLYHGHTFTANPLGCAAALASLELLQSSECQENRRSIQRAHEAFVEKIKGSSSHECFQDIRQIGTLLALEFKTQKGSGYFNELKDKMYTFFISRGLLLRPLGNVLYVLPPYCSTDEDMEMVYENILEFTKQLQE